MRMWWQFLGTAALWRADPAGTYRETVDTRLMSAFLIGLWSRRHRLCLDLGFWLGIHAVF